MSVKPGYSQNLLGYDLAVMVRTFSMKVNRTRLFHDKVFVAKLQALRCARTAKAKVMSNQSFPIPCRFLSASSADLAK